jgi:Phosphotransferase enzyme family
MASADDTRRGGEADAARGGDWRILLPSGAPRTAVCFGATGFAEALESAGIHLSEPDEAIAVDVAVSSDVRLATLRSAADALRPGGAMYLETQKLLPFGRRRLTRRLRRIGLVGETIYWRAQTHGVTTAWVPLAETAAVRHFLGRHTGGRTRIQVFVRRLAGWAFRAACRVDMLFPLAAVAQKPKSPDDPRDAEEGVLSLLGRRWNDLAGDPPPTRLSWLVLAPGTHSISKIVAFVFAGAEREPRLVVKGGRTAAANAALEREASNLHSLEARAAGLPAGAPRCLLVVRRPDQAVLVVETVVAGTPLYETLSGQSFRRLGLDAVDWLVSLVRGGSRQRGHAARAATTVLAGLPNSLAGAIASTLGMLDVSVDHVPVAFEQRDFSPWNLLLDAQHRLGVVDWESAEPEGFPLLDLVYFLANCGFLLDRAESVDACVRSYRRTFDGRGATGAVARECIEVYVERVGLSVDSVSPLRALTWAIHLHAATLRSASPGRPGRLPSGSDLFAALLREELG